MKVEKKKFDSLLSKMLKTETVKRDEIKARPTRENQAHNGQNK